MTTTTRLTISLPTDLVHVADDVAREQNTNRSKVMAECLREFATKRIEQQMREGYKARAKKNLEFAEMAINIAHEVLPILST